ncbi:MAG: 50S ribosomal protein L4 [Nitrospirae bacterium]|nr:50S ribosomal protein L4 [Candidatus Troglogloeales bacterium]
MIKVEVKNRLNEIKGAMGLSDAIFGVPISIPVIHEVVTMQQASMRQGTAQTKTKGFVRGGGKKPWAQKGTGRARAGSRRSPIWKGGGTIFGPISRAYGYSIPKKKARLALFMVLSSKVKEGKLVVLEDLVLREVKTRSMVHLLTKLQLEGRILILVMQKTDELDRVSRNLPMVDLLEIRRLNLYDLICSDTVLTTQRDLERLEEVWRESA